MKNNRFVFSILIASLFFTFFVTGCKMNEIKVDDPITVESINKSSSNVAEGFIQSVFTNDEELFYKAFPYSAFSAYIEAGNDPFEMYCQSSDNGTDFYGIAFTASNEFTEENGYDENWMISNISTVHCVDIDLISSMELVKVRVYFYSPDDKEYQSTDVYILTYKLDNEWFVYEMANSDAEFTA